MNILARKFALVAFAACAALSTTTLALADCEHKGTLVSTGTIPNAAGTIEVKASGTTQRIQVKADLAVNDGTKFAVITKTSAGPKVLGTITVELGSVELKITNNNGNSDPAKTDPFCSVHSVAIVDGNLQPVLTGTF
ncbi:MAG: hypothetical protein ABI693_04790 [Bryobacteraceae bacterium]